MINSTNINWKFLLNIGFDEWYVEWLNRQEIKVQQELYRSGYTISSLDKFCALLNMGFKQHTILGLWMKYPNSFMAENVLFFNRLTVLIEKYGMSQLNDFFWKYDELGAWEYLGRDEIEWEKALKVLKEEFQMDRKQKIQKLVSIGFAQEDVDALQEYSMDFQLDVLAEYYLEEQYLKTLKFLLESGFSDILLQLFMDNPERFTIETPLYILRKRKQKVDNIQEWYKNYGDEFLDAFLDEDERIWINFLVR